ncbi:hypothetical protein MBTS_08815 [Methylobacterium bullatum]|nr:hypothetical protein [Methylobacterium bullatum]
MQCLFALSLLEMPVAATMRDWGVSQRIAGVDRMRAGARSRRDALRGGVRPVLMTADGAHPGRDGPGMG